jgi:ATP-binding cassette subfamily B protein
MRHASFHRALRAVTRPIAGWLASAICGIIIGLTYVFWMVLVVLLVEFLAHGGTERLFKDDAEFAASLGEVRRVGVADTPFFETEDAGMLAAVVDSRNRWYGGLLSEIYRRYDFVRHNDTFLAGLLGAALLLGLARTALLFVQARLTGGLAANRAAGVLRDLFDHAFKVGPADRDRDDSNRISSLVKEEIPRLRSGLNDWLSAIPREPAKLAGLFLFLVLIDWMLALAFLLMALMAGTTGYFLSGVLAARRRKHHDGASGDLARLQSLFSSADLITAFSASDHFRQRYDRVVEGWRGESRRAGADEGIFLPLWGTLGLTVLLGFLALAARRILDGVLAPGEAAGVAAAVVSTIGPVWMLLRLQRSLEVAERSAERIYRYLDQPAAHAIRSGSEFFEPPVKHLEFDRVSCRDAFERDVIRNVSFRIAAGAKVALVSTDPFAARAVARLLVRLIDPMEGQIRCDDRSINRVTLESLREQIAVIMQGELLFADSILNNIGCGDIGYNQQKIVEAAKTAHAHQFIQRLPHGYECVVGEGGFPLKVGEAFRIAMARAVLRDPPIIVIEEPTESLDEETKAVLDDTARRFLPGRTVIYLPGRLSTLRGCDQIILLDQGKVAAQGAYRDLIQSSELLRHLEYTRFSSHRTA